jgi:hypothetical protein
MESEAREGAIANVQRGARSTVKCHRLSMEAIGVAPSGKIAIRARRERNFNPLRIGPVGGDVRYQEL